MSLQIEEDAMWNPYAKHEETIEALRQQLAEKDTEIAHWKNNHATEVRRARILKERTDMPIERVQAYERWCLDLAENAALRQQLFEAHEARISAQAAGVKLLDQLADKREEIEWLSDEIGYQSLWKTEFRQQKEYAEKQFAASQAREQQLRDALENIKAHDEYVMWNRCPDCDYGCKGVCKDMPHSEVGKIAIKSIALPADTSALEALIAKAGEVMRKRAAEKAIEVGDYMSVGKHVAGAIRALTGVTLEDLK